MTESILNIELHPAYFAYAIKAPNELNYTQAQIDHIDAGKPSSIDLQHLSVWLKGLQNVWNRSFQKIFICIHGYPHTITPDAQGGELAVTQLSSQVIEQPYFVHKYLKEEFCITMMIPPALKKLLDSYFWGATLLTSSYGICQHILNDDATPTSLNLHITPREGTFFYKRYNEPVYLNAFNYTNQDDLLYYVLLVYQKLFLSVDSFPLTVSGLVEEDSEIYKLLYQYIRNISIADFELPLEENIELSSVVQPNYLANLLYIAK